MWARRAPQNRSLRRGSVQPLLGRCRNVVKTAEELRPRHRFTASGSCRRQRVTVDVRGEAHQSRGGHPSENVQYAGPAEIDDHDVPAAPDEVLRSRDEACAGQYCGNLRAIDEIGRVRHCLDHGDLPVWVVSTLCSQLPHRGEIRCHRRRGADGVGQHRPRAARRHELTNPHQNHRSRLRITKRDLRPELIPLSLGPQGGHRFSLRPMR